MDKPIFFNFNKPRDRKLFSRLKKTALVVDEQKEQIGEWNVVKKPALLISPNSSLASKKAAMVWIYYSWRNSLVHCLNQNDFRALRSSRNQHIITRAEQKKFEKFRVGIAGLNVGNPGALCLALQGDLKMKLADNDVLSLSNLNRFRAGLPDLGLNKAVLSARQIYEINPFAELEVFERGITDQNMEDFLLRPRINILIEEMDDLVLKIRIREMARRYQIPVVMVTGNGPNVIIDVERFDQDSSLPLLNGYLRKRIVDKINSGPLSFNDKIALARDFMGKKYLHRTLLKSFREIGTKLAGIPQIAESSFLRGAALSYVVRQIAQGNNLASGRYVLNVEKIYG